MIPAHPSLRQTRWQKLRGRLFHLWFLFRRPMTLGARAVVFDRATRSVFLIEHTYVPGWQLPGGGVERGESVLDALRRELAEEGNITIEGAPDLVEISYNSHTNSRDHVALFLITEYRQTAAKVPDMEIKDSGFFPLDALPEATTPGTQRRIAEAMERLRVLTKGEPDAFS